MNTIKINYSQFLPSALLAELQNHYHLPSDSECIFFKSGLNDIYKITAENDTYYLRVSLRGVYSTAQISEEIDFILYLRGQGLSVVEPIPCKDGSYVLELSAPEGMRQAVLFRGIVQSPAGDADTLMYNLGRLLAQVHEASLSFDYAATRPVIDRTMLVEIPTSLLTPFLSHRSDDLAFLHKTALPLWDAAETMLANCSTAYGICHGDVQSNNYYFRGAQPILFDFDCMGWGYFAYDFGVLLANLSFADNNIHQTAIWTSMLDGYQSVRPLLDGEKKAIYLFAALHMLRVLSYHAKLREQNHGAFYFMTDQHLNMFFGAYRRLTCLANEKASLQLLG